VPGKRVGGGPEEQKRNVDLAPILSSFFKPHLNLPGIKFKKKESFAITEEVPRFASGKEKIVYGSQLDHLGARLKRGVLRGKREALH